MYLSITIDIFLIFNEKITWFMWFVVVLNLWFRKYFEDLGVGKLFRTIHIVQSFLRWKSLNANVNLRHGQSHNDMWHYRWESCHIQRSISFKNHTSLTCLIIRPCLLKNMACWQHLQPMPRNAASIWLAFKVIVKERII